MGYRAFSFEIQPFLPQTPKQVGMDCELLTFERAEAVVNTNVFLICYKAKKENSSL